MQGKELIGKWMRTGKAEGLHTERKIIVVCDQNGKMVKIEGDVVTFPPDVVEKIFGHLGKLSILSALGETELIEAELESPYICYAMVKIGIDELNDTDINISDMFIDANSRAFAYTLDSGLTIGDGALTPEGEPGTPLGILKCGCPEFEMPTDAEGMGSILEMERTVGNIAFMMNTRTEMWTRSIHGTEWGTYLWNASEKPGQPNTLMARPIYNNEDLPDGTIVAGNFREAIRIRLSKHGWSICRLTEMYDAEGLVGFQTKIPIDLKVVTPESLRIYHFSSM